MKTLVTGMLVMLLACSAIAQQQDRNQVGDDDSRRQARWERWFQRYLNLYDIGEDAPDHVRIKWAISKFKEMNVYDPKSTWFEVEGKKENDALVLTGEVMFPQHKNGLETIFDRLGYKEVQNNIKVLPEDGGLGTLGYALVTSYTTALMRDPREARSILDQALYGAHLRLLKASEDKSWYLVQVPNGYVGLVKAKEFRRVTQQEMQKWISSFPRVMMIKDIEIKVNDRGLLLPKGGTLPVVSQSGDHITVLLPDNGQGVVSAKDVRLIKPDIKKGTEKILEYAKEIIGVRYKWAGYSSRDGYDCSGFSRIIYTMREISIPRDADQQSSVGALVAYRGESENLLPGDLLFFAGHTGRISHVAVSLGGKGFIHSSRRDIHIKSFDPASDDYDEDFNERFAFARRIIIDGF